VRTPIARNLGCLYHPAMAQGPWHCSKCGTINEPVANSCRTCGKWPSLFDLEDNVVDEAEYAELSEAEPEPMSFEPTTVETPVFEPPPPAVPIPQHMEPEQEPVSYEETDPEAEPPRRRWTSAIIPIAVLLYFVISAIADRG
jgi:hypothetical protein